jgi:hypothetical protein
MHTSPHTTQSQQSADYLLRLLRGFLTTAVASPNTELTVTSLGREEPKSASIAVSLQETISASTIVEVRFLPLPVITLPVTDVPEPSA